MIAGAIVLTELNDYEEITSTEFSRPAIGVTCLGAFLTIAGLFGAYGGYNEMRNCMLVVCS